MSICIMEEKSFCKECVNKINLFSGVKLFNDTQNIVRAGFNKKKQDKRMIRYVRFTETNLILCNEINIYSTRTRNTFKKNNKIL